MMSKTFKSIDDLLADIERKKFFIAKIENEREMIRERYKLLPIDDVAKDPEKVAEIYAGFSEKKKLRSQKSYQEVLERLEAYAPVQQLRQQRKLLYQQLIEQKKNCVSVVRDQPDNIKNAQQLTSLSNKNLSNFSVLDYKNIHYVVR